MMAMFEQLIICRWALRCTRRCLCFVVAWHIVRCQYCASSQHAHKTPATLPTIPLAHVRTHSMSLPILGILVDFVYPHNHLCARQQTLMHLGPLSLPDRYQSLDICQHVYKGTVPQPDVCDDANLAGTAQHSAPQQSVAVTGLYLSNIAPLLCHPNVPTPEVPIVLAHHMQRLGPSKACTSQASGTRRAHG